MKRAIVSAAIVCLAAGGCRPPAGEQPSGKEADMELTSTAFKHGDPIPARYTGDGADVSPPLAWSGVPPPTRSLALICDDPDAPGGTWVHWVLYDLPSAAAAAGLPEGVPGGERVMETACQGRTDFGDMRYGGPAPPPGKPHRYFFKLYALDIERLGLQPGASRAQVDAAMKGHVLARGELMGTYGR